MFNLAAKESHRFIKNYVGGFFLVADSYFWQSRLERSRFIQCSSPMQCNFISWNLQIKNHNQVNLCMHNTTTELSALSIKVHLNKLR